MNEARDRAWATRRAKYGPKGHAGYRCRPCESCTRMRDLIVKLVIEGVLSEGQASRATMLSRVELRRLADNSATQPNH